MAWQDVKEFGFALGSDILIYKSLWWIDSVKKLVDARGIQSYWEMAVTSHGNDLGFVLGLSMIGATIGSGVGLASRSDKPIGFGKFGAVMGGVLGSLAGISAEWGELLDPASKIECLETGYRCGDVKDLLVFAVPVMAILVDIWRKKMKSIS